MAEVSDNLGDRLTFFIGTDSVVIPSFTFTGEISQIINDEYGCNFRTKLNECRMKIAKKRILDVDHYGNLTIQAIAESVGYKSQSGFVQIFKKATGFTPSMFQKMARENS